MMIDVMQHKLVGERQIWRGYAETTKIDLRQDAAVRLGAQAGQLIVERWPPTTSTNDEHETLTLTVYVFSPAELAQLITDTRDRAVAEVLAVADTLTEQEKPNEQ